VDLVVRWTDVNCSADLMAAILIQLNEDAAGPWRFADGLFRLDVTDRLGPRNELWIELPSPIAALLAPASTPAEAPASTSAEANRERAELPWSVQMEIFVAAE
jgi:hypothetical protein